MIPRVIKVIYFLIQVSSLQADLYIELPRGRDDSLRGILLENLFLQSKNFIQKHKEGKELVEESSHSFSRETSLFLYNNVSEALKDSTHFQMLNSEMTSASLTTSKQFRTGGKLEFEANISEYKSATTGPKAFRGGGVALRLNQPLLKGFRLGNLATQEKLLKLQHKIDTLNAVHELSETLFQPLVDYWALVLAKECAVLRMGVLKRFERLYQETRPKIVSGELSDLSSLISEMALAKRSFLAAEKDLLFFKRRVEEVIGREVRLDHLDSFPKRMTLDLREASLQKAFAKRKDLQALNLFEEGISLLIAQKRNEKLPTVDLNFDYKIDDVRGNFNRREKIVGVSLSYPTYKERRVLSPQVAARNEAILGISSKKGEIASEIDEIYTQLESLEGGRVRQKERSLNHLADLQEKSLRMDMQYAISLGRLKVVMGDLLEVDSKCESIHLSADTAYKDD